MLDINDGAQRARGRAEVLGIVVRRRRWTAAEKGRIVAEAIAPGAVIAAVARRHDLAPQHLGNWIRAAKSGRFALPAPDSLSFVPVVAAPEERPGRTGKTDAHAAIEIVLGSVVVRIGNGADKRTIESVLRALAQR
jgi:transposase